MKMRKKDLIKARIITQNLLCQTLKELLFSVLLLIVAGILTAAFVPSVIDKVTGVIALLMGLVFGIVVGAARAYNIFWEKIDMEKGEVK